MISNQFSRDGAEVYSGDLEGMRDTALFVVDPPGLPPPVDAGASNFPSCRATSDAGRR
jgi:hypothetical protein